MAAMSNAMKKNNSGPKPVIKKEAKDAPSQPKISSFFNSRPRTSAPGPGLDENGIAAVALTPASATPATASAPTPPSRPATAMCAPSTAQAASAAEPIPAPALTTTATVAMTATASVTPSGLGASADTAAAEPPGSALALGEGVVGMRVRVYWRKDKQWFVGRIARYDDSRGKHQVVYDDGDEEWLVLNKERYQIIRPGQPEPTVGNASGGKGRQSTQATTPGSGSKAKAANTNNSNKVRRAVIMSDDGEEEEEQEAQVVKADVKTQRGRLIKGGGKAQSVKGADAELEDEESDWEADEASSDEDMEDLEDEAAAGAVSEDMEDDDDGGDGGGKKRKRSGGAGGGGKAKAARTPATQAKKAAVAPNTGNRTPASAITSGMLKPSPGTANTAGTSKFFPPSTGGMSHAGAALQSKLTPAERKKMTGGDAPGSVAPDAAPLVTGISASMLDGEAANFIGYMSSSYPFLHPAVIMDAKQRRPTHPDYDPRTLHIPKDWFKKGREGKPVSEGQVQWWEMKAQNFDSIMLFKMGKFYEMYNMDAAVGVDVLGLSFMKGDQPHAGFPEVKYHQFAEALARAGHRVVVVEQTETPEQLKVRNEERKRSGLKMCNVVNRQKIAVLTRGTLVEGEMVAAQTDAQYVFSVAELPCPINSTDADGDFAMAGASGRHSTASEVLLGLCVVDAASGQVLLGQFRDDAVRSHLRTQLTALQPVEVVLPREELSATTARVLRIGLRQARTSRIRGPAGEWSGHKAIKLLREGAYFAADADATENNSNSTAPLEYAAHWPPVLRTLVTGVSADATGLEDRAAASGGSSAADPAAAQEANAAALSALCGMVVFLQESLLDKNVLPLGRIEALPALGGEDEVSGGINRDPEYLLLNGASLESLEILENSEGGTAGTLLAAIDHCTTPFGRRRLRQWLCRPLGRAADIVARQDAVAALMGPALEAAGQARKLLAGVSDVERAIARLHASTVGGQGRDAAHVVLYEDAAKRKVKALVAAIKDLESVRASVMAFQELGPGPLGGSQGLLWRLLAPERGWAECGEALAMLSDATDWKDALATGRVVPAAGIDAAYDEASAEVVRMHAKLATYLKNIRVQLGGHRDIAYVSVNKDSHLVEVPESLKVPSDFERIANRKGYIRYTSTELRMLVGGLDAAVEVKEALSSSILQTLICKFVGHNSMWNAAVDAVAELDALMSLAAHALNADGPMCRPELLPYTAITPAAGAAADGGETVPAGAQGSMDASDGSLRAESPAEFIAVDLRHPAGLPGREGSFVPNSIALGGERAPFLLISGPNMGGKSTLLRQTCLATVLAQIGACVPADSLRLHPADAIFVRMGAKDQIMTGQSTFFVELSETAAMLHKATSRSLLALDELGRGTATLDGAAIAGAVLQTLAHGRRCRGLFATHYHHLSDVHAMDPTVAVMHMGCAVAAGGNHTGIANVEQVTFLYKLTEGACPKSYGTNVAQLAGLPDSIVARAAEIAAQRDAPLPASVATAAARNGGTAGPEPMDLESAAAGCCMAGPRSEQSENSALLAPVIAAAKAAAGGVEDASNSAVATLKQLQTAVRGVLAATA